MNQNYFQHYNYFNREMTLDQATFLPPYDAWLLGNIEQNTYIPFGNYSVKNVQGTSPAENMLYQLMAFSFAMHDLGLYLDVHPTDERALKLFNQYQQSYLTLKKEYDAKYETLSMCSAKSGNTWQWVNGWPWQGGKS